jgi:aryl-alcohol dehydrogenase-like predicted oxidoreductase
MMADLPTRQLGRTGLDVTMLGYGALELSGRPSGRPGEVRDRDITEANAEAVLNAVLDAGINYIDTAPDYGVSEERIGKYIAHRRSEYFLCSKCGCVVGTATNASARTGGHVFTAENVVAGVEQSLRRLKTDYLDVVQFHGNPSRAQLEEQGGLEALLDLQRQGKVRWLGVSGELPNLTEQIAMGVFDVFQIPYSAVEPEHEAAMSQAVAGGAGVVVRSGVARGSPGKQAGDTWAAWQRAEIDDLLGDMTPMELVLRFTISNPAVHTTIVGTANLGHLQENLDAARKGPLPAEVYEAARRRFAAATSDPER